MQAQRGWVPGSEKRFEQGMPGCGRLRGRVGQDDFLCRESRGPGSPEASVSPGVRRVLLARIDFDVEKLGAVAGAAQGRESGLAPSPPFGLNEWPLPGPALFICGSWLLVKTSETTWLLQQ